MPATRQMSDAAERDADVVQQRAEVDRAACGGLERQGVREQRGDVTDALCVADRFAFGEVEPEAECDRQLRRRERVNALWSLCERASEVVEREDRAAGRIAVADHRYSPDAHETGRLGCLWSISACGAATFQVRTPSMEPP